MSKIQKIAIKYFIIGIGVVVLTIIIPVISLKLMALLNVDIHQNSLSLFVKNSQYFKNIVIGFFILFDSLKFVKNKISISVLGFCLPIFGVCFLIIEYYLLQKTLENE